MVSVPTDTVSVVSMSELYFPADAYGTSTSGEDEKDGPAPVGYRITAVSIQTGRLQQEEDRKEVLSLASKLMATEKSPLLSRQVGKHRSVASKVFAARSKSWNKSWQGSYVRSVITSVSLVLSGSIRRLQKSVGCIKGFCFIVGALIGSGVFISPSLVVRATNDLGLALVIWLACGIVALFASLCYCELGCAIKKAGGTYTYILEAYGPVVAFLCSWTTTFVSIPASVAGVTLTFGTYLAKPFDPEGHYLWLPKVLAASLIFMVAFVNCWSTKVATQAQSLFALTQISVVLFMVVLGIWQLSEGKTDNFKAMFNGTSSHFTLYQVGQLGFALYSGLWAYDGWALISNVTEEMHNVERNLLLSVITGIPFVIICYLALNCSLMTVLSTKELASSTTAPILFVRKILGTKAAYAMPILAALSCYGAANGNVFSCSRLAVAASREGHMPDLLCMIHRKRLTPMPAIIVTATIAGCMLGPGRSSLESLVEFFNFTCWTMYGLGIIAVVVLRIRKPDLVRPYKVWIVIPIFMALVSLLLVTIPFLHKPMESSIALSVILSGLPAYFIFVYKESSHPRWFKNFREAVKQFFKCRMNLAPCHFQDA